MARSACALRITQESLISDVEIISMLTRSRESASNIFAATPEWLRIPMPTIESLAIPSSVVTSPAPMRWATLRAMRKVAGKSCLMTVKETSVAPSRLTFWTIMSTLTSFSASSRKICAAMPGLSGTSWMVTLASSFWSVTPLTTTSSMALAACVIMVPSRDEKLDRTWIGTLNRFATKMERACMTCAPSEAISSISS